MSKIEGKLLGFLSNGPERFNWRGWKCRRYRSQFFYLKEKNKEWCTIGMMTITPKLFFKISLKLWHEAPYRDFKYQFDPNRDFHWYELIVTDELMSSGKKSICHLIVPKGENYYGLLENLFRQIQPMAIFSEEAKSGASDKKILKEIAKEFQ